MTSLSTYLFDWLFPADTTTAFRDAFWQVADQVSTWLIIEDGITWLPWELVVPYRDEDNTIPLRFLSERYHLARWIQGLGTTLYSEVPLGEIALTHYKVLDSEQQKQGVQPELFWGFRYPIGHTYWAIEPRDRIRLQKGIFSAIHHKLLYSLQEVEQLTQQLQRVCQSLGSELSVKLLDQSISSESLCIDSLLELFNDQNFCYGMIHFACHCWNPVDTAADRSSLSFTAHNEDLEIELEKLLAWEEDGFQNCPFVFLNACESATPGKLLETLRFPTAMLKFGAGGVIATACTVPDNFASAFASKFYEFLLTKLEKNLSVNIGEVLLETRLYFLHHFNNPLGLAYGLYALSNQELRLMD